MQVQTSPETVLQSFWHYGTKQCLKEGFFGFVQDAKQWLEESKRTSPGGHGSKDLPGHGTLLLLNGRDCIQKDRKADYTKRGKKAKDMEKRT